MDEAELTQICQSRLARWQKRLVQEHATPVLLLGVGHDDQSGKVVVLTLEEMSDSDILMFVGQTINLLKQGKGIKCALLP